MQSAATHSEEPLISNRFVFRLTFVIGLLVVLTVAISFAGSRYGKALALAGHTDDTSPIHIIIGEDVMVVPANVIRFENERISGRSERLDTYVAWPEMSGYTPALAARFNSTNAEGALIFVQFTQSVMTRDMSGRFEPIYSRLFEGEPVAGPAGLTLHHLKQDSGFGDEVILSSARADGSQFVVRCHLPESGEEATNADCQRDVHIGNDLSMLYRFSSKLLPQWAKLDAAITSFAARQLDN